MSERQKTAAIFIFGTLIGMGICYLGLSLSSGQKDPEKLSYALGYQIGKNLKGSSIDLDSFTKAIRDGSLEKKSLVSAQEITSLTEGPPSEKTELAKQISRLPWVLFENTPGAPVPRQNPGESGRPRQFDETRQGR